MPSFGPSAARPQRADLHRLVLRPLLLRRQVGDHVHAQVDDLPHPGHVDLVGRVASACGSRGGSRSRRRERGPSSCRTRSGRCWPAASPTSCQVEVVLLVDARRAGRLKFLPVAVPSTRTLSLWLSSSGRSRPTMSRLNMAGGVLQREQRVVAVPLGAEQAELLAAEGHEHQPPALAVRHGGEAAGQLHDRRGAGAVVVGAVVDLRLLDAPSRLPPGRRSRGGRSGRRRRPSPSPAAPPRPARRSTFLSVTSPLWALDLQARPSSRSGRGCAA